MRNTTTETLETAVAETEVENVSKPVEHLVSETRQFHKILETETPRFTAKGLSESFLSLGEPLADMLENSEAQWVAYRFGTPEAVKVWKDRAPGGYRLRNNLMQDVDLALMFNKEGQSSLDVIRKGSGDTDMTKDIVQLVKVARKYPEDISATGLTEEHLAAAEAAGKELSDLFATAEIAVDKTRALKFKRDQAKTFTANFLSMIRRYADVIYRDEPEKRELFVSAYDQEKYYSYKQSQQNENSPLL